MLSCSSSIKTRKVCLSSHIHHPSPLQRLNAAAEAIPRQRSPRSTSDEWTLLCEDKRLHSGAAMTQFLLSLSFLLHLSYSLSLSIELLREELYVLLDWRQRFCAFCQTRESLAKEQARLIDRNYATLIEIEACEHEGNFISVSLQTLQQLRFERIILVSS